MSVDYEVVARRIPIELIDPPRRAARQEFGEEEMHDLIASIQSEGLIEPIVVRPIAERYEVVAGHRRWYACQRAGEFKPPCIVRDVDERTAERIKVKENKDRENVNPVDDGIYYEGLLADFCDHDVKTLAEFVDQTYGYVSDRLNVVRGCPLVRDALQAKHITLGVAQELNRIKLDSDRRMYLRYALSGAKKEQVRAWRLELERHIAEASGASMTTGVPADGAVAPGEHAGPVCIVCRDPAEMHKLRMYYVHSHCHDAILRPWLRHLQGGGEVSAS